MVSWNLVDALKDSASPARRRFYLPLASLPPGLPPQQQEEEKARINTADWSLFQLAETRTPDDGIADAQDVAFHVTIKPPAGRGFEEHNGLPDPLIRLHAMDRALVEVKPSPPSLVLTTFTFTQPLDKGSGPASNVPWWERWSEARSIPQTIIYENVDIDHLRDRVLSSLINPNVRSFGLGFPLGVVAGNRASLLTDFLDGKHPLMAEAGAYLGVAAKLAAPEPGLPADTRRLTLHVRYHDHGASTPHPMNPRELFYLLFGNDSIEATGKGFDPFVPPDVPPHPLLRRMEDFAKNDPKQFRDLNPPSRRMLLRPPLRTWKRVEWEADQEIHSLDKIDWAKDGSLGPKHLYCTVVKDGSRFQTSSYAGFCKCNVFAQDICLRAGFRVCILPTLSRGVHGFHYHVPNSLANLVVRDLQLNGVPVTERRALLGDKKVPHQWGWNLEAWLLAQPAAELQQRLNQALHEEGRCLVLVGARPRAFHKYEMGKKPDGSPRFGIADCNRALDRDGSGHIVIVADVVKAPVLVNRALVSEEQAMGLQRIHVRTMEATGGEATNRADYHPATGGGAESPDSIGGYLPGRLHLVELHPGGDPDTPQGLRDLAVVIHKSLDLLGTLNEWASDQEITDGPSKGLCCRDPYPQSASPEVVACASRPR